MKSPTRWKLWLSQIETAVSLGAMLIALAMEGACVHGLRLMGAAAVHSGTPSTIVGPWTAPTLPQCWLLGAVLMLLYRIVVMLVGPANPVDSPQNRRAIVRLWCWTVAVGSAQIAAIYLERVAYGGL